LSKSNGSNGHDRTPERTALAESIEAHRLAKRELSDCHSAIEKASEHCGHLLLRRDEIREQGLEEKRSGWLPPGVALVRERLQNFGPVPCVGNSNSYNEMIECAVESMKPPPPSDEERKLEFEVSEWRKVRRASEGRIEGLERKVVWSKLAVESKAAEVMAATRLSKETLESYEIDRARIEQRGGGLRYIQSRLGDSALNREVGLSLRPLRIHPRTDLEAAFNELCSNADSPIPEL
jgi:hypothetical protein